VAGGSNPGTSTNKAKVRVCWCFLICDGDTLRFLLLVDRGGEGRRRAAWSPMDLEARGWDLIYIFFIDLLVLLAELQKSYATMH
jgi:hypothetical protein